MKIQIPKTFMGKPVEGALERVLSQNPKTTIVNPAPQSSSIVTPTNFNGADYVQVPQIGALIGKREVYRGLNWNACRGKLDEDGLVMPRIDLFMHHFNNVYEASEGRRQLLDGLGNPVSQSEATSLWNYLSSKDRSPFNGQVCWTWLDAFFKNDNGTMIIETNHRVNRPPMTSVPLDPYLDVSGKCIDYTKLTNQGIPRPDALSDRPNEYVQGKNIYFWKPVENRVARFYAGSNGAYLSCNEGPSGTDASLGVFPCAVGTSAPKTGGNS